jgi:hypothetical protein
LGSIGAKRSRAEGGNMPARQAHGDFEGRFKRSTESRFRGPNFHPPAATRPQQTDDAKPDARQIFS